MAIRPIFHRTEQRIEAHIFVAFLAYCLQVTLKAKRTLAGGTTPREVIEKFKTMQMVDVHLPTTDGREFDPVAVTRNPSRSIGCCSINSD